MAVYQYYLAVIPKEGILKKHNLIPTSIGVSTESGYFESDAKIYWDEISFNIEDFVSDIDKIVNRKNSRSDDFMIWKTYSEKLDNDAYIKLNEKTFSVKEFSFRADLREQNLKFLKDMIHLGKKNNWLFMDRNGTLMNPDLNEIKESIKISKAYRFIQDPIVFIKEIVKNK